jgi:hypothetical protein
MAEFTLGTRVNCSDGFCGKTRRAILDPATRTVTHLVIEPQHWKANGRLVPIELVDAAGGEIRLRCSLAEFERLEPAEEADLAEAADYDGGYGSAAAVGGYGDALGMGAGAPSSGMGVGLGRRTPIILSHAVPLGETEVERHESVHAVDGEIGRVEGFIVDPSDHKVTHVLLQEGHLWGRKEVAIPISAVSSVDAGIRLNITKKQVEELPPPGPSHP